VQTELFFSGISLGGVYGITALGLALVLNVFGIANLGHGAIMIAGPLMLICAINPKAFGPFGYLYLFILALALWFTWRFGFRLFSEGQHDNSSKRGMGILVMGLGLINLVEELGGKLFTGGVIFLDYQKSIPGFDISIPRAFAVSFSVITCVLTHMFLKYTDAGRCILAVSQNPQAATMLGIRQQGINLIVFGYSVIITMFSGVILASIVPLSPFWSLDFTIKALLIVGLARPLKITDIIFISFALGCLEVLIGYYLAEEMRNVITYVTFIAMLISREKLIFKYEKA